MLNNILEISQRSNKNGRVPIKIALLKIHDDPNETNKNGIHCVIRQIKRCRFHQIKTGLSEHLTMG